MSRRHSIGGMFDIVLSYYSVTSYHNHYSPIDPAPLFKLVDLPFLLEPSSNQCEDINDADEFDLFMAKPWKPII